MSNLFRVDFIQGKTDAADYNQVKHSLIDTASSRKIINLSVSSEKLMSVSNYTREPRRVVFECFPTTWIQDYLLSGVYEHERYISHYEVKIYRDTVLFFSGIIITSDFSWDVASGIIKIACYDKLKLLSIYADLTHNYNLISGYTPSWVVSYFLQDIRQTIPVSTPFSSQFTLPELDIPMGDMITIARGTYDDMWLLPANANGWTYSIHATSWAAPIYGYVFLAPSNQVIFVFVHKVVIDGLYGSLTHKYLMRVRAHVYHYYNSICPVISEYDNKAWADDVSEFDSTYNEMLGWLISNGITSTILGSLASGGTMDGRSYGSSHYINYWVEAACYGNLYPSKLHLGKGYEEHQDEYTENLKALQAMLMFYNATLTVNAAGTILLSNKGDYGSTVVEIDDDDVVSMSIRRANQEVPNMSTLDVLAGDTTLLQQMIKDHLMAFYGNKWSIDVVIDQLSKYSLALQGTIMIGDNTYAITELERDYINDEYKVKAWQL